MVRLARRLSPGALSPAERAKVLFRIARVLQERARELAVVESLDGGKPIKESRDVDLPLAAAHFFYYAGWADKLEYAFPNRKPRPLGVAAQIIPWNFPLLMLAWKIAPALACGNTVVLKPAETTPLTALLFADDCRQAAGAAGRRQHRHGRRRDRCAPRAARWGSTRSRSRDRTEVGKAKKDRLPDLGQSRERYLVDLLVLYELRTAVGPTPGTMSMTPRRFRPLCS